MEGLDFVVSLDDQMSGPARAAAAGLEGLEATAGKAESGLGGLAGGLLKVQEPTETMRHAFDDAAEGMREFTSAVADGDAQGAIEGVANALAGVSELLDLVVPGLGQAASAIIKVAGGFAGVAAGVIQSGIEMSISATQAKQSMISLFDALGHGVTSGAEIEEMISGMSQQLGVTKDQIAPVTTAFLKMGITGKDALEKVTKAGLSAMAISKDTESAFESMTKKIQLVAQTGEPLKVPAKSLTQLVGAGIDVVDIAKRMGMSAGDLQKKLQAGMNADLAKKFGDAMQDSLIEKGAKPLERMGMSLDNLKKMFTQNIEDMFEDMGDAIAPVMKDLRSLFSIFSQSSPSGRALKAGIGGAFTFIFQQVQKTILPIKHFLLDIVIWSLKAYIQIKSHWSIIKAGLLAVGIVLGVVAAAVGITVVAIAALVAIAVAVPVAIGMAIAALVDFGKSAVRAGSDFIDGLVGGITDGIGKVVAAAKNVGQSAMNAVKGVLGIASPSKVGMQLGKFTGEGVAMGLDQSTAKVETAGGGVGEAAAGSITAGQYSGAKSAAGAKGGSSSSMTTGPITIQLTAPNGITNAIELTEAAVAALFERIALQRGVS